MPLSLYVLLSAVALSAAQFSLEPDDHYTVIEGNRLEVPCQSDDTSIYQYWTKDGEAITVANPDFDIEEDGTLVIRSAEHAVHTGSYSCTLVDLSSNNFEAPFTITVHYIGTDIALRRTHLYCVPDANTAYFEGSLTLECLAPNGEPMVNVTWYRSGVKLRQVDEPTIDFSNSRRKMVISDLMAGDTGTYHCEAVNSINRQDPLISEGLYVMVTVPDTAARTISIEDSDQVLVVGAGRSAELVCKIVPAVPVDEVVWLHDSKLLSHGEGGVSMVQRGHGERQCCNSLHLDHISEEQEGVYECRHTDTHNLHAQRPLALAALDGPLVVEATPTSLIAPGRLLSVVCGLSEEALPARNNIPPQDLDYHWTHNSAPLSEAVKVVDGGRELLFLSTSIQDSGHYECAVNSDPDILNFITASIDITVEASPQVSIGLLPVESEYDYVNDSVVYVQLGASVTLLCTISSSRPANFTWFKEVDDKILLDVSLSSSSTLTLPRLTPSQLTSYHCGISDSVHDLVTSDLTLVETTRPYVRDAAAGTRGAEFRNGTRLQLLCEVRGGSGFDLMWVKGDLELTNQTTAIGGSSVTIVTEGNNSTLTIYGVTTRDAGEYECVVDGSGMESRLAYVVVITVPGRIESTSSQEVTVTIGDSVRFDCLTLGIPPPTISWLFNSQPLEDDPTVQDLGNGSLFISSVSPDHAGSYNCYLVENGETRQFTLTVSEESSQHCGGDFSRDDCILLLSGGAASILILLLALIVLLICVFVLCRRWRQASIDVSRDLEMKRVLSSRASSHKENGAAAATNFSDATNYLETHSYGKGLYPNSVPVTLFDRTVLSDMQRSVTPPAPSPVLRTPGTGGTDSMFSSDDQSSLTASLPNFPRSQLKLSEELGEGEFGPVVLGVARNIVSHEDTTQVVVKVLVRSGDGEDQFQPDLALVDFANQMKIEYEHISCILGLCTDNEPYYVLYEYLDQGDLKRYLLTHRPLPGQTTPFTPHALSRLVLQVADGMAFLFSQRIIHGDLATRNCLVSSDHRVKIADLGIGHDLYQTDYYDNGSQLLPIRWMPPELLVATENGPAFSLHSDIWSFGVLCWEVFMFGELPYEGVADVDVLERVPRGHLLAPPPSEVCPERMRRVMEGCWAREPDARPRFSDLCMDINMATSTIAAITTD